MNYKLVAIILSAYCLAACSHLKNSDGVFRDRLYDYQKAVEAPRMQLPAGYDDSTIIDYYPVPPLAEHANQELITDPPLPPDLLVDEAKKVRIQRLAAQQWILVQVTPSQLWPKLKQFVQQNQLSLVKEDGQQGFLLIASAQGFYRFRVRQGFQYNSSELALRYSADANIATQWPELSAQQDKESDMLAQLAQYLADSQADSYSLLAHSISLEKRLIVKTDNAGIESIWLKAQPLRAYASLKAALQRGNFSVLKDEPNQLWVQFTPQNQQAQKRGFWARLFRIKAKAYDDKVPYAGRYYQFRLHEQAPYQVIDVRCVDKDGKPIEQEIKEINQQLNRIEGVLI